MARKAGRLWNERVMKRQAGRLVRFCFSFVPSVAFGTVFGVVADWALFLAFITTGVNWRLLFLDRGLVCSLYKECKSSLYSNEVMLNAGGQGLREYHGFCYFSSYLPLFFRGLVVVKTT